MTPILTLLLTSNLLLPWLAPCTNATSNAPTKAPLYWSAYEYCYLNGGNGGSGYIPEEEWKKNIDWVAELLLPHGYDMICIDGWGDDTLFNENGYRTTHSSHWKNDYAWWASYIQSKGMSLGMYQNPLWINRQAAHCKIKGREDLTVGSLIDAEEPSMWFTWVQVNRPGAEEYVKSYIQFYADMGISYLRVDFLSWFEDGIDRNPDYTAPNPARTPAQYAKALQWMKEACDANGITLSLVMPHLYNHAATELQQAGGSLIRVNDDVCDGTWWRFSEMGRGEEHPIWPTYHNTFDGLIHWSDIAGFSPEKMVLDADFTRIHTFQNRAEKESAITLQIVAGAPIAITDCYNTVGDNLHYYTNEDLLALNAEGFVSQPLTRNVKEAQSQIWHGKTKNGDIIVALFNREQTPQTRSFNIQAHYATDNSYVMKNLWDKTVENLPNTISKEVPPHGCVVYRVSKGV